MRATITSLVMTSRDRPAGGLRRPGNLTLSQRGKICLAVALLSVAGWAVVCWIASLVYRWVS